MKSAGASIIQLQEISDLISDGQCANALKSLEEYEQRYPQDNNLQLNKVGLLVDIGMKLNDINVVKKGVTIGKQHLHNDQYRPYKAMIHYNMANGYQYEVRDFFVTNHTYFGIEDVARLCLNHFNESLSLASKASSLVNLGNFYDEIGRPLEALLQYEKAIDLNHHFGMALANKAQVIETLAQISTYHTGYLVYAYQLYEQALQYRESIAQAGGKDAAGQFQRRRDNIKSIFDRNSQSELLGTDLTHKKFAKKGLSKEEISYTKFCLDNDLYLNLHIFDRHSDASIGDHMSATFITNISDEKADKWVKEVLMRLNEIKESYITGRYILWLSQQKNEILSSISKQSLLVNNLDYTANNIYTGLLKSSYKEGFSVLDKIANTIDFYLKLNRDENKINYRNIWYINLEKNQGFEPAMTQQNHRLFGVFSVLDELGEKPSKTRNAIEHRYQRLGTIGMDEFGIPTFREFSQESIDVYYKIKCAIIYLFNFINACEEKKKSAALKSGGILPTIPIHTDQWLDLW